MVYYSKKLLYSYGSIEPEIDEKTMMIHHTKHYQGYIDNLNKTLENYPELIDKPLVDIINNLEDISEEIRSSVRNNGGGILNHEFFFSLLKKNVRVSGGILTEINRKYGSFEIFKSQFKALAMRLFGSGWTWLVMNRNKEFEILNTSGHQNPISIDMFFKIIDWDKVNEILSKVEGR
jgi:Fe-Mn family superoxide dismutase